MKMYSGFKSESSGAPYPMLPAGAYVCVIRNLKVDGQDPDQSLVLRLDVVEGDWAGYYTKRYDHDSQSSGAGSRYEVKYKGDLRLQIPNENNAKREHLDWDERAFNNACYCIEKSNEGVLFDWDKIFEGNFAFLKGKLVGISVREGEFNGNKYTQIARLEVADHVRKGLVKPMKPRAPRGSWSTGVDEESGFTTVESDDLPF